MLNLGQNRLLLMVLIVILALSTTTITASAAVFEGTAIIENGNVIKAEDDAKKEAMRQCVESIVGVQIDSETQTDMGLLVADKVVSRSTGYVQIKKIISQGQKGNIYFVKMDLEADRKQIDIAFEDVKSAMQASAAQNNRRFINLAIVGYDENNQPVKANEAITYIDQAFKEHAGFQGIFNNEINRYLVTHSDLDIAAVRQIGMSIDSDVSGTGESANAIVAGQIKNLEIVPAELGYIANVKGYFYIIGLRNDYQDTFIDYATAHGATQITAIENARRELSKKAAQKLGAATLQTMQLENRGGTTTINTVIEVVGISDQFNQGNAIMNMLKGMNLKVKRKVFTPEGILKISVQYVGQEYANAQELGVGIETYAQGSGLRLGLGEDKGNAIQLRFI